MYVRSNRDSSYLKKGEVYEVIALYSRQDWIVTPTWRTCDLVKVCYDDCWHCINEYKYAFEDEPIYDELKIGNLIYNSMTCETRPFAKMKGDFALVMDSKTQSYLAWDRSIIVNLDAKKENHFNNNSKLMARLSEEYMTPDKEKAILSIARNLVTKIKKAETTLSEKTKELEALKNWLNKFDEAFEDTETEFETLLKSKELAKLLKM